mgnify:CR=1 FL=1
MSLPLLNRKYLDFVTEFYKIMLRLIDRSSKKVERSELGELKYELQCHLWILKEACAWFVGRVPEIDQVKQYITGLSNHCFVVYGPPGSGNLHNARTFSINSNLKVKLTCCQKW